MKRLTLAITLALAVIGTTPAGAHETKGMPCPFDGMTRHGAQRLIRCEAVKHGVSPRKALDVAECESGFAWFATSSSGEYKGLFQLGSGEWQTWWGFVRPWAKVRHRPPTALTPRANVIAAMAYQRHYGWGPWSCA